jgi:dienelactone hydrolase
MMRRTWIPLILGALAVSAWAVDESVPQAQVGSLYPFVQAQADHASMDWSFLNPAHKDLEKWQRSARRFVLEQLHTERPRGPVQATLLERVDCGDHIREKLLVQTTPDIQAPAYVLIPKDGKKRHPAVLLLHDHGAFFVWGKEKVIELPGEHPAVTAFKQAYYGGRSVGNEFVKRGYVVMAIDMFYWGERRMKLPGEPAAWADREKMSLEDVAACNRQSSEKTWLIGNALFEAGTTWAGVMLVDDLRSVDYLAARADVDPDRIGCCGLSVGGFRSAHLAGLDPRIKAAVVVGWMCSYPMMLKSHLTSIGFWATMPGLQQHLDLPDVVSMHAPQPLMIIHGTRDGLFPNEGVQAAFDKIERVYQKAGAPGRFRPVTFDGPHQFNAAMQDKAFDWMDRWMGVGQ